MQIEIKQEEELLFFGEVEVQYPIPDYTTIVSLSRLEKLLGKKETPFWVQITIKSHLKERAARLLLHLVPALQEGFNSRFLSFGMVPDKEYEFLNRIREQIRILRWRKELPEIYRFEIGQPLMGTPPVQPNRSLLLLFLAALLEAEGRPSLKPGITIHPEDQSKEKWMESFLMRSRPEKLRVYLNEEDQQTILTARKEVGLHFGLLPTEKEIMARKERMKPLQKLRQTKRKLTQMRQKIDQDIEEMSRERVKF